MSQAKSVTRRMAHRRPREIGNAHAPHRRCLLQRPHSTIRTMFLGCMVLLFAVAQARQRALPRPGGPQSQDRIAAGTRRTDQQAKGQHGRRGKRAEEGSRAPHIHVLSLSYLLTVLLSLSDRAFVCVCSVWTTAAMRPSTRRSARSTRVSALLIRYCLDWQPSPLQYAHWSASTVALRANAHAHSIRSYSFVWCSRVQERSSIASRLPQPPSKFRCSCSPTLLFHSIAFVTSHTITCPFDPHFNFRVG